MADAILRALAVEPLPQPLVLKATAHPPLPPLDPAALAARLAETNPRLRAARAEAARREALSSVARRARIPDLDVSVFRQKEVDKEANGFSVGIKLPLWNANRGEIARAEAEQRVAAASAARERIDVLTELEERLTALVVAADQTCSPRARDPASGHAEPRARAAPLRGRRDLAPRPPRRAAHLPRGAAGAPRVAPGPGLCGRRRAAARRARLRPLEIGHMTAKSVRTLVLILAAGAAGVACRKPPASEAETGGGHQSGPRGARLARGPPRERASHSGRHLRGGDHDLEGPAGGPRAHARPHRQRGLRREPPAPARREREGPGGGDPCRPGRPRAQGRPDPRGRERRAGARPRGAAAGARGPARLGARLRAREEAGRSEGHQRGRVPGTGGGLPGEEGGGGGGGARAASLRRRRWGDRGAAGLGRVERRRSLPSTTRPGSSCVPRSTAGSSTARSRRGRSSRPCNRS